MSGIKLSELATTTVLDGNELVTLLQDGSNRNTTLNTIVGPINTQLASLTATSGSISVDLSTLPTLPTTVVDCFNISEYRSAKLVISCYSLSAFQTTELLVTYYGVQISGTLTQGVQHTRYGTLGSGTLVEFSPSLVGNTVKLTLTPSITGIHVDIYKISV
jgi:hypothetical protein